jgi:hypothetical protein
MAALSAIDTPSAQPSVITVRPDRSELDVFTLPDAALYLELDLRHNALGSRLGEAEPLRSATAPAAIPTAVLLPVSQASLSVAAALGFAIAVQGVRRLRLDGNPNLSDAGAVWILRNCLQPKRCPAVITLSGTGAGD